MFAASARFFRETTGRGGALVRIETTVGHIFSSRRGFRDDPRFLRGVVTRLLTDFPPNGVQVAVTRSAASHDTRRSLTSERFTTDVRPARDRETAVAAADIIIINDPVLCRTVNKRARRDALSIISRRSRSRRTIITVQ